MTTAASFDDIGSRIDIDRPRYDQSTYSGRAKHFFITTNPLNVFRTSKELEEARDTVLRYRSGQPMVGLSVDDIWRAKHVYDSAYHPDTGEKMLLFGRMSFQVPGNMSITGCMLQFRTTVPAVVFWQWVNQTFNAAVNYTNRNANSPISTQRLGMSYALATTGAVTAALGINSLVSKLPPLVGRFVPFAAVAIANCINIPCMRSSEITNGIPITDSNGNKIGSSTAAAKTAIGQVVVSRIIMACPGMIMPPLIMEVLEKRSFMKRMPWLGAPIQVLLCGVFLTFTTPMCCALFPQVSSIRVSSLETSLQEKLKKDGYNDGDLMFYNKGL